MVLRRVFFKVKVMEKGDKIFLCFFCSLAIIGFTLVCLNQLGIIKL